MLKLARCEKVLLCILVITGVTAGLIYRFQGMTGGGHGKLDLIIALLGLPSFLLLDFIPHGELLLRSGWSAWIIFPAAMNFLILLTAIVAVRLIQKAIRRSDTTLQL